MMKGANMQISGFSGYYSPVYNTLGMGAVSRVSDSGINGVNTAPIEPIKKVPPVEGDNGMKIFDPHKARIAAMTGHEDQVDPLELKALKRAGIVECSACANRKYQDGSDEANVSFKTAAHVDPSQSEAAVTAHEGMHVKNAVNEAATDSSKTLTSASVSIHYATCPECGRRYAAGGLTTTTMASKQQIPVNNNPYAKNQKSLDEIYVKGAYVDEAA